MSYTKNSWQTGDIVTSAKLNNMENGIANATPLIITWNEDDTLSETWQTIHDALAAGRVVLVIYADEFSVTQYTVNFASLMGGVTYVVHAFDYETPEFVEFVTDSPNGYPAIDNSAE